MRDREAWSRLDTVHFPANPAEPGGLAILKPAIGQQLHADTDAEERHAALQDGRFKRIDHAVHGAQAGGAVGIVADPR